MLGYKHCVHELAYMLRVFTTSFQISLGSLGFWRLGSQQTICMEPFFFLLFFGLFFML